MCLSTCLGAGGVAAVAEVCVQRYYPSVRRLPSHSETRELRPVIQANPALLKWRFQRASHPLMRPGNLRRLCQTREFVSSSYLRPDAERRQKNGGVILFKQSSANVIPSLTGLIGPHCVGGVSLCG
ncbi:hypothetical protein QQF64_032840 [Cirrhinus molitorella]|uniref:Uncharacterized protein n=1 Tax=Cirrhinus molitorella TaxID=172907 RepID=A0ABR3MS70_9TELE